MAGIYEIKPEILNFIPDKEYFGADVIKKDLFVKNKPFTKYEISEYWLDIWKVKGIHNQHYKAENA